MLVLQIIAFWAVIAFVFSAIPITVGGAGVADMAL